MKNTFVYLLISLVMFGCAKNEEDEVKEVVPLSATELRVALTGITKVSLNWKDNATNESGFKIERKTGTGSYVQVGLVGPDITQYTDASLAVNTMYTYRVLASNATGDATTYSNEVLIDIYPLVTIGTQTWTQKNLDVDHYRNGDIIPQVTDPTQWANLTTGAWCYYANNTSNGTVYGKLYNWYAVNDPRGLAPLGWHVATSDEWITLTTYLGGSLTAGGSLKATEYWTLPNEGATNSTGFTAFGGGFRNDQGAFSNRGILGGWWTATNDQEGVSFYRVLYNNSTKSEGYHIYNTDGLAVRCVRD